MKMGFNTKLVLVALTALAVWNYFMQVIGFVVTFAVVWTLWSSFTSNKRSGDRDGQAKDTSTS